jgi:hypothetical protein
MQKETDRGMFRSTIPKLGFGGLREYSQHSLSLDLNSLPTEDKQEYNHHTSGHYPPSCLLSYVKTQLNSLGLSVPHRKHITSQLRTQQVNAIYKFVTMIY